jgi:hypothetical protein
MLFAVAVTSLVTAALLVICYLAEVLTKKPYVGWVSFAALVTIALVFVLGACLRVYQAVHADIVRGWP